MSLLAISSGGSYTDVAAPSAYHTVREEIVKSSRNTLGNLYKYRITTKMTISVEWVGLTSAEKSSLMALTEGNQFSVKYFDLNDSTYKYGNFYRGAGYSIAPTRGPFRTDFSRYDVSMDLVEF